MEFLRRHVGQSYSRADSRPFLRVEKRRLQQLADRVGCVAHRCHRLVLEKAARAIEPIPVVDGIELHVREDSPAAREEAVIAMREAVRARGLEIATAQSSMVAGGDGVP